MERYVSACRTEMALAYDDGLEAATTLFVGGGTPSLLPPAELARLISGVHLQEGAEVTVECNPETTSPELLEQLREVGVNRISLGVQSFAPHVLEGIGRRHIPGAVERAIELVGQAGFPTFSVDIIYGGAHERDEDWLASIDGAIALGAPHVSAYALHVEPGTPLAKDPARHPDDDAQADRYLMADERLRDAGLFWYEISNFARPGHECRHNVSCWRQCDYRGFGCAAHSHQAGTRSWNIRSVDRYVDMVEMGRSPCAGESVLDEERRALEQLELALRTTDGVPVDSLVDDPAIEGLIEPGRRPGTVVLTPRGRLLANEVTLRIAARPEHVSHRAQIGHAE